MKLIDVIVLKEWIENWFTKNRFYHPYAKNNNIPITELYDILEQMPSAQAEVIPHRNYKYLSDYWCECGWHLGKKGEVKYCADCGKRVKWDD